MRRVEDRTEPTSDDDEGQGGKPDAAARPAGVGVRIVARIIDPSVREDAQGDLLPVPAAEPIGSVLQQPRGGGTP